MLSTQGCRLIRTRAGCAPSRSARGKVGRALGNRSRQTTLTHSAALAGCTGGRDRLAMPVHRGGGDAAKAGLRDGARVCERRYAPHVATRRSSRRSTAAPCRPTTSLAGMRGFVSARSADATSSRSTKRPGRRSVLAGDASCSVETRGGSRARGIALSPVTQGLIRSVMPPVGE